MDTKLELARRLRAVRVDRGLTQAAVAKALGVHRPTISEIEAGRRSVTGEELYALSRLFSASPSDLLPPVPASPDERSSAMDRSIRQMGQVIADLFHPEKVILFGSHARGEAGPDSDVDLLVVIDVDDSRRRTGARIGAALHGFPVPKDVVVTTPEAFLARKDVPGTIECIAAMEGRVLHAAG